MIINNLIMCIWSKKCNLRCGSGSHQVERRQPIFTFLLLVVSESSEQRVDKSVLFWYYRLIFTVSSANFASRIMLILDAIFVLNSTFSDDLSRHPHRHTPSLFRDPWTLVLCNDDHTYSSEMQYAYDRYILLSIEMYWKPALPVSRSFS